MRKIYFVWVLLAGVLVLPSIGLAVDPCCDNDPATPCSIIKLCNPLNYDTFEELVESVANFIFVIALALAPLMIIIGAFYLITAGGDPGRVKTAKMIFLYTGIGILIVLFARGLIAIIRSAVGVSP